VSRSQSTGDPCDACSSETGGSNAASADALVPDAASGNASRGDALNQDGRAFAKRHHLLRKFDLYNQRTDGGV
jgi:hypothetical protein